MVDSGVGRTERAQGRERRVEPRRPAKADDREMRQPAALLAPVDLEGLQPAEQILRKSGRSVALVREHEHADAAGLAVAERLEPDWSCGGRCLARRCDDRIQFGGGTVAEEGERDVDVRAHDDALGEMPGAPLDEFVEDVIREPDCAEETQPFTAFHASRKSHAASSRLCVKSRRTRWSAVTVARLRMLSRSPGNWKSAERSPSGACACTDRK